MATKFKVKRSTVSGITPTTGDIDAAELAINLPDRKLFTSNGSSVYELGSNLTTLSVGNSTTQQTVNSTGVSVNGNINLTKNDTRLTFTPVAGGANVYFVQQNDDNFVLYTTNTSGGSRAVFNVYANTDTPNQNSAIRFNTPVDFGSAGVYANNSLGITGQVLTSNGSAVYWSSAGGTGTVTQVSTGNGLTGGPITTTGTISVNANTGLVSNSTGLFVNSTYIGTLSANNATYLNGQLASYYTNATNITTGTLDNARLSSAVVNTSGAFTFTGVHTHSANVILGSSGLSVNGSFGSAGQVLHSNGTATYWDTDDQGVTSVATGNGLTGGTITTTGTVSVLANSGIVANTTGIYVNANSGIVANTTGVFVNANTGLVSNSSGLFVNSSYIGTLSANNATYLNGQLASYYTNASNITTGTLPWTQAPTGTVNTSGSFTFSGVQTYSANVILGSSGLSANGGFGTAGQVLHSNGTATYWDTDDQGVTSVATGNGLTGGTITTTGTVSVLANSGIVANTTGIFVNANNGIISNTTGVYVNANTGLVANATGVFVNSSYIGTLSANNTTYLNGQLASYYTNATNITTGTLPWAQAPTGTVNTSGSFTFSGVETFNANVIIGTTAGLSANGGFGTAGQLLTSNGTGVYWSSAGVNTAAQYAWTNTHSFAANLTILNTSELIIQAGAGISANGGFGTAGQVLTSNASSIYWSTPSTATAVRQTFTANSTVNTSFTVSGGYTVGFVDVYKNGIKLINGTDVTVSSGTAVVLATPALVGEVIDVVGALTGSLTGVTTDGTQTLTNKRIDPRVFSTASASSVTPDISTYDMYVYTALAAAFTINATTGGSPVNGSKLVFRFKDNGTARSLTWTTAGTNSFRAIGVTLPTTTVISKVTYVGCIYNSDESFWDVIAVTTQA